METSVNCGETVSTDACALYAAKNRLDAAREQRDGGPKPAPQIGLGIGNASGAATDEDEDEDSD